MRPGKGLTLVWIAILFTIVGGLFWYNEYIYSLPTPVPDAYRFVNTNETIDIARSLHLDSSKPIALHFFNPDCPCSRFNLSHFRDLVKKYGDDVNFVAVPMIMLGQEYSDEDIVEKLGVKIPVWRKPGVAEACGVYSTPQSVVLNSNFKLYYRGNYNKSRYCTDKRSNYAEMAITSLVNNTSRPQFDAMALKAYGCTIEGCVK
jgi:hypothetical protein